MPKIAVYKVPVKVTREPSGQISLEPQEDQKVLLRYEPLTEFEVSKDLLKTTQKLQQDNDDERESCKFILSATEESRTTSYLQKIIIE